MHHKYGTRSHNLLGRFYFYFSFLSVGSLFNKTIIPLVLVGYEVIIANSELCALLAIYNLISNVRS